MERLLLDRRMQLQNSVEEIDPFELEYFTINCTASGGIAIYNVEYTGGDDPNTLTSLSIKINDGPWVNGSYSGGASGDGAWYFGNDYLITLSAGDTLKIKGTGSWYGTNPVTNNIINRESSAFKCTLSGNINSLVHGDNFVDATIMPANALRQIFYYSGYNMGIAQSIIHTEDLRLPAKTVGEYAYASLFYYATYMETPPPILPATTLGRYCYNSMFSTCAKITHTPELPAVNLEPYCYNNMFYMCSALTTASDLPATTLKQRCYATMFASCTKLETAPELPATELISGCYSGMFRYCNKLKYVKAMFLTQPTTTNTGNWLNGVSSTGTFVKNSAATWTDTGTYAVPTGWTIQYASS